MTVTTRKHVSLPKWQIAIFWTATAIMVVSLAVIAWVLREFISTMPLYELISGVVLCSAVMFWIFRRRR